MKKVSLIASALSIIVVAAVSGVPAQTYSISGRVTNGSGAGLPGVAVKLAVLQKTATTDSSGYYSLSGTVGVMSRDTRDAVSNTIQYKDHKFFVQASSAVPVSIQLYTLLGRVAATVYNGRVLQGRTVIPFSLKRFGNTTYLVKVKIGDNISTHTLVSLGGNRFSITGISSSVPDGHGFAAAAAATTVDWLQGTKAGYAAHTEALTSYTATCNFSMTAPVLPDFGANVSVFDPSMTTIQTKLNSLYTVQDSNQFGSARYAFLFKPGKYNLDVNIGFYTEVLGLGITPDSVSITGNVHAEATWMGNNATCNFWRAAAGLCVTPSTTAPVNWAVSQGTSYRRMHVKGSLKLTDGSWGSGGFIADTKVDNTVFPSVQQQWLSRNDQWGSWAMDTGSWNLVFVGDAVLPTGTWPTRPYTFVPKTPLIREKPFLIIDNTGNYSVVVPNFRSDSTVGVSWNAGTTPGTQLSIDQFYIAKAGTDNATTINAALASGKNLLITPGIYHLTASLLVQRPNTVVLGIGYPLLVPDSGTAAVTVSDVDGVSLAGLMVDAGARSSPVLVQVGEAGSTKSHGANPTALFDIFCRAGGAAGGMASCMVTINSSNVIGDNFWLWRADHGAGAGWTSNKNANGLIVNGNNVTVYGLFVEHTQEFQTQWNGNGGRMFMYQSELPYDPPNQSSWMNGTVNGYPSYKVANTVTSHEGWGLGVYCVFTNSVICANAIEAPNAPGIKMTHMLTLFLAGKGGINHVISGVGGGLTAYGAQRVTTYP